jgi:hypothetical protein
MWYVYVGMEGKNVVSRFLEYYGVAVFGRIRVYSLSVTVVWASEIERLLNGREQGRVSSLVIRNRKEKACMTDEG